MAYKMAQEVAMLAAKLEDLSLIPNTQMVESENISHKLSSDHPMCPGMLLTVY